MNFRVTVLGLPAPQGSKSFKGRSKKTGRGIMVESCKRLPMWRKTVMLTAIAELAKTGGRPTWGTPIVLSARFFLPRPQSARKNDIYPSRKPDLSKLVRAIEDSLVDAKIISDDATIVEIRARKFYARKGEELQTPGVIIELSPP